MKKAFIIALIVCALISACKKESSTNLNNIAYIYGYQTNCDSSSITLTNSSNVGVFTTPQSSVTNTLIPFTPFYINRSSEILFGGVNHPANANAFCTMYAKTTDSANITFNVPLQAVMGIASGWKSGIITVY